MKNFGHILLFIHFFVLTALGAWGQELKVTDQKGEPLAYAHITLTPMDGSKAVTVLSDFSGRAIPDAETFNKQKSKLLVFITYMGYLAIKDTIAYNTKKSYQMEPDAVTLNQLAVTAQYSPNSPEKAVHKIKIIDEKKIDAQGAVNLRDVLRNETNINLSQDNILGSSVSIQGISGQNVKILVDGVPVVGRLNGNVDISQINLNDIERIEIVEGPLSVNYGTDALAGTINLISKKSQETPVNLGVNTYYETVGQYNLDGRIGWSKGIHNLSLSGGRNYFDGWSPTDPFIEFPGKTLADSNRYQEWNPKEQIFGKLQYSVLLKSITIRPYLEYFNETITNRGKPADYYEETAFDDYYITNRANFGVSATGALGTNGYLNVIAAYNNFERRKNTYYVNLTTLDQDFPENSPDAQDTSLFVTTMSRGSYSTTFSDRPINFELGYDINYETADGKRIEDGAQDQGDYAAFGSAEITIKDRLILRPGLRYAYNTVYNAPLIPSINLKYSLPLNKGWNWNIRASFAKGFRAPSLKELYFEFVDSNHNIIGNEDLEAETSNNYHLDMNWQRIQGLTLVKLDASVYFNDIENLITTAQSGAEANQFAYVNIGQYKTLGFQGGIEWAWAHYKVNLGGSYIGRKANNTNSEITGGYYYTPELRVNLMYEFKKAQITLASFYKYTGKLANFNVDENGQVSLSILEAFNMLDITASKYFWKKRLQWTIGGKNLFNVQNLNRTGASGGIHSGGGSTPMSWGTSIFTSLKFNINW